MWDSINTGHVARIEYAGECEDTCVQSKTPETTTKSETRRRILLAKAHDILRRDGNVVSTLCWI